MWCVSLVVLVFGVGIESLVCPIGKQPCGSSECFDPTIQGCKVTNTTLQCLNLCNGTCIPIYQYCYNNVKACNKNESVCVIKDDPSSSYLPGPRCYDPSQMSCYNGTLCYNSAVCGSQCMTVSGALCANNKTICTGLNRWEYSNRLGDLDVCGPQQQCYDKTKRSCLNGTIICEGTNAQLCDGNCFNPDTQICVDNVIECITPCNGSCYWNSEYCYNDTIICKKNELVCDVQSTPFGPISMGFVCYDPSRTSCLVDMLCDKADVCGTQCLWGQLYLTCVKNQKACQIDLSNRYFGLDLCGPQQECYFTEENICVNETTVCEKSKTQLCGSTCYNPNTQICINGATVQCLNSCNGVCYSNSQYCYNNTLICDNEQLFCDIKAHNLLFLGSAPDLQWGVLPGLSPTFGPACYDPSMYGCYNNTICLKKHQCGEVCLLDAPLACAKNQTICDTFFVLEFPDREEDLDVCGPQKQCYHTTKSVCLNDTVQCLNSCGGTCYSASQYCYNDTKICNSNESICDVTRTSSFSWHPLGLKCYDPSQSTCYNGTLCDNTYTCGSQCLMDSSTACAKNQTICYGFSYWNYNRNGRYLDLCGPQQKCYDNSTSVCLGTDGILCPIGSALCSGACYNPDLYHCAGGNSTTYYLNDSSEIDCEPDVGPGD